MPQFWTHPLTIRTLGVIAMAKAFLKFRNPRRVRSGEFLAEFHDRMWRQASCELGADFTPLGSDIAEIALGASRTRTMMNVSAIDDPVTLALAHDKPLVHRLLIDAGLPVPDHVCFRQKSLSDAVSFLRTGEPCVVKPASGTGGGRGVTTGILTLSHLAHATAAAAVYADDLMIERQIDGDNYRLLYLDGVLVDAFVRKLPYVIGDGRQSVRSLVEEANRQRLGHGSKVSQVLLSVDQDMIRTVQKQKLRMRSVPADGQKVVLKTVVNENNGADNTTASHLCPQIIHAGAQAVKKLRLRFGGVDIITPDATVPLQESGGVIIEVNGTPNLYYHYNKADGSVPVATILLRRLLVDASGMSDDAADSGIRVPEVFS